MIMAWMEHLWCSHKVGTQKVTWLLTHDLMCPQFIQTLLMYHSDSDIYALYFAVITENIDLINIKQFYNENLTFIVNLETTNVSRWLLSGLVEIRVVFKLIYNVIFSVHSSLKHFST